MVQIYLNKIYSLINKKYFLVSFLYLFCYYVQMQENSEKTLHLAVVLGSYLKELRIKKGHLSRKKFADEYDLNDSNLSRIERGLGEIKFVTLLKILQALDITPSEFMKELENKLGKNFTLIDE